ncbi:MAG: GTP-binding protein, partial [Deltaproteobacteria bacterium]|nr:GTP-binding protein [Deltaproteobacteria bacterium]
MKTYDTSDIRNVALIGHKNSGKTSLAEALLFAGKQTNRLGSIQEHNTVMDFEAEEQRREMSIQLGVGFVEHQKRKLNFVDTPGEPNFFFSVQQALAVCEGAVLVISASDGVQASAEKAFNLAREHGLACAVFVSKIEREQVDFTKVLADLRENLSPQAVALQLPIGAEADFTGVVDLVERKALTYKKDGSGSATVGEVPAEMKDAVETARAKLIEEVASADDALLEKFLEAGELSEQEMLAGLQKGIGSGKLVPVLCGSSTANIGAAPVLDLIADAFPSPADRGAVAGLTTDSEAKEVEIARDPAQPFVGYVFSTYADQMGIINCCRVFRGAAMPDTAVLNTSRNSKERFGSLVALVGKKHEPHPGPACGDIFAVVKLKDSRTGDTLTVERGNVKVRGPAVPSAAITFAVRGKSKGDEDKIGQGLNKLAFEDPSLFYGVDPRSKDTLVSGVGQVHIEVALEKLKRRTGLEVELLPPKVPYRETIRKKVQNVEGKHKKQTGGRGQFG